MSKEIYIILSHTGSMYSTIIKKYTRAEYTHASIAFDRNLDEIYSFGRLNPNNPFIGGFVKEDIEYGTFAKFKNTEGIVYSIPITNRQYRKLRKLVNEFKKDPAKYGYNLKGVIALSFGIGYKSRNKYFCSQFVATLLHESNIIEFQKKPFKVTPTDLQQNIRTYDEIYNGKISKYPIVARQLALVSN